MTISLDLGVQHVLRQELKAAMATYRAKAAASVVIDIHSGEVVGLVSLPDYDPNRREQALDKERANRIAFGVYEMGSVFKVFTVAGVLDSGLASMRSSYDASGPIHYGRFTISDFHGKGRALSVPEAFIYSSNIASAKMALHMGVERHRAFLKKLGLTRRVPTEIGETATPIVPAHWQKLNTMTIAFGHGLSVTPLQMATASLPLFNGGIGVQPTFLPRSARGGRANEPTRAQGANQRIHAQADAAKRAQRHGQTRRIRQDIASAARPARRRRWSADATRNRRF